MSLLSGGCIYCSERRGNPCPYCGTYWAGERDPAKPKSEDRRVTISLDEYERELKARKPRPPLMNLSGFSRFLDKDENSKFVGAIGRMEAAGNPGLLNAAKICFPPPIRTCIAYTLHALIWSMFFFFITPIFGILFIILTYAIGFGYTWPRSIKRVMEASFSR